MVQWAEPRLKGDHGVGMPADFKTELEHLAIAERHIDECRLHIERQTELIERMEAHGHDTQRSRRLLETFENSLRLHLKMKGLVLDELRRLGWKPERSGY
jgi:hypothetical protein